MKLAIVLGRGVEGCGVTRFAIEIQKFMNDNNIECKIYASIDKKWGRQNAQEINCVKFGVKNISLIKEELETFDIVSFSSLPSKSNSQEFKDSFYTELVVGLKNPIKISIQNDHLSMSLSRNDRIWEITKEMDYVYTFSENTIFAKKIKELGINVPIKTLGNGFNFEELKKFKKDKKIKRVSYLGRFATFKDPQRMIHLEPLLTKEGILSECRGIEKSIGSKFKFFSINGDMKTCHENIKFRVKSISDFQELGKLHVYGPYVRDEALEEVSNSMFGANFFNLKKENYSNIIEYATLEIIGIGCIPIIDSQWAENNFHLNGKSFEELDFGIRCKKDDFTGCIEKINYYANNSEEYFKKVEKDLQLAIEHCDSNIVFKRFLNELLELKKSH